VKYNILKLEQHPKGSVHCSAIKNKDRVETYESRFMANEKIKMLKSSNATTKYIIGKHWR